MKKVLALILALMLCVSIIPTSLAVQTDETDVSVEQSGDTVTIGNSYIAREFSTSGNKLTTTQIINKRTDGENTVLVPQTGSEEFKIRTIRTDEDAGGDIQLPAVDRTGWSVTASSEHSLTSGGTEGPVNLILDGNTSTFWHTNYGVNPEPQYPHHFIVKFSDDCSKSVNFNCFSYTPRPTGDNGNIKEYKLYYSNSAAALAADSDQWTLACEGTFKYDGANPIYVNVPEQITATQVKLLAVSSSNGRNYAGCAEFNLHEEKAPEGTVKPAREFYASDLTLASSNAVKQERTTAVINGVNKEGVKLTFTFAPYTHRGVEYTIKEVVVMYDGDHFMRKFLEITVPEDKKDDAVIDYIDLETMMIPSDYAQWTIPEAGGIVLMEQFKANLGQPVYIQGMFFGCEFPAADTQIEEGDARIRYYTGKSFTQLGEDNQLCADGVTYMTWQTVAGAARSTEHGVIQTDFYDYIDSIATPSEFRIQYNSWFDNMMYIDDESILTSFSAIDKNLTATGVRPIDSYVVDDGWNNYNSSVPAAGSDKARRSGTTLNTTGFWEFNDKFPNKLTPSSELVQSFGSNFGVWIGPRGGYNFPGELAGILSRSGKGSSLGGSIDVADRNYLKNFEDMAIEFQEDYGVNYWKWDGFAENSQYNSGSSADVGDGKPGRRNNHMVGGYHQMYHVTDLWEAWIDLFENVRSAAERQNIKNLWISITCYVNPSPWYLQWVNSIWMQCAADRAENGPINNKMDRMLTYRDAAYYCFVVEHEFQLPLKAIYNHDPIYGKTDTGINKDSMTDEQFKNNLYAMAGRGTSFWELYYSDSIMTPGKYEANAQFLKWAEDNFHILQNAKMIGGDPCEPVTLDGNTGSSDCDAYGFSAWDGEEGIITMRNPGNAVQTLEFTVDRNTGAAESLQGKTIYRTTVHSYNVGSEEDYQTLSYGDTVTVSLKPGEVRTWYLSPVRDTTAPEITKAYFEDEDTIVVKFSEVVTNSSAVDAFTATGAEIGAVEQSVDDVTYRVTLTEEPENLSEITLAVSDKIRDLNGNACTQSASVVYRNNGLVYMAENVADKTELSDISFSTQNQFAVAATVQTDKTGTVIAKQDNGYILGIDADGKAYFEVNGARATSKNAVNDNEANTIVGTREVNGILKIYVNGAVSSSAYKPENKDFLVPAGNVTISDGLADGELKYVAILDKSLGYDEVEGDKPGFVPEEEEPDEFKIESSKIEASVSGVATEDGGRVENIFDENADTFWTSQSVSAVNADNAYVDITLDKVYDLTRINYTKRYHSSVNYNCTGNITEYVIRVSEDGENWTEFTGSTATNGGVTEIVFPEKVKAKYVRVAATQSYHWQNPNTCICIAELELYAAKDEPIVPAVDKTELQAKKTEAETALPNVKTDAKKAAINAALETANTVLADENATQAQVDAATEALVTALAMDDTPLAPQFKLGDVDHSDAVDATDATLVLQRYADIIGDDYEGYDSTLADVSGDNSTDATDATLILQLYANIITEF